MRNTVVFATAVLFAACGQVSGVDAGGDSDALPTTTVLADYGIWSDDPSWCVAHPCAHDAVHTEASWASGWVIGCGSRAWGADRVISISADKPGAPAVFVDAMIITGTTLSTVDSTRIEVGGYNAHGPDCMASGSVDGANVVVRFSCGPITGTDPVGSETIDGRVWVSGYDDILGSGQIVVAGCDL